MIKECLCGNLLFEDFREEGLDLRRCKNCGVIHQRIESSIEEYFDWYRNDYLNSFYTHTYQQDRKIAKSREEIYFGSNIGRKNKKILDFGCGNRALVDELSERGHTVYGCDLYEGSYDKRIYSGLIEEIAFPTSWFDVVIANDVLEHIPDLLSTIKELSRIIADDGYLIIDHPEFLSDTGKRHWKQKEHIWFISSKQLIRHLIKYGFSVVNSFSIVPDKTILLLKKLPTKRKSILVPPGIGDIYWIMCKLESFIQVNKIEVPDIYISSTRKDRDRSKDYVLRFPTVNLRGYHEHIIKNEPIWRIAYHEDGDGEFTKVLGFDYFLSANGPFRFNKRLEEILPRYQTNWFPKMFISNEEREFGRKFQEQNGKYIVLFFTDHGMYQRWIDAMGAYDLYNLCKALYTETKCKVVLTGASWDDNPVNRSILKLYDNSGFLINMIGRTTLEEFLGLLRYCNACVGFPGGNTILATYLKKPTIILWNDFYNRDFWKYSCPPSSLGKWYIPLDINSVRGNEVIENLLKVIK